MKCKLKREKGRLGSNYININPNNAIQANTVKFGSVAKPSNADNNKADQVKMTQLTRDVYQSQNTFKDFIDIKNTLHSQDTVSIENKEKIQETLAALSPVIPFRRISSLPDKIESKDYIGGAGLSVIALLLLPEDLRDVRDAFKQILYKILPKNIKLRIVKSNKNLYRKYFKFKPLYNLKEYQTPFSFIRGSFLEKYVNKMVNKYGYKIHEWDKPLIETKLGKKIKDLLKVSVAKRIKTGRKVPKIEFDNKNKKYFLDKKVPVKAEKLKGSFIGKLICRALQRTTLFGTLALCGICLPSIVKAFNKPENTRDKIINGSKQTLKSAVSITSVLSGIGLGGALLATLGLGAVGSVVGMGLGSVIGAYFSSRINKNIKTES